MAQRVAVRAHRGARFLVAQHHALRASVAAARAQAVLDSAHQVGRDVVTPAQGAKGAVRFRGAFSAVSLSKDDSRRRVRRGCGAGAR